MSIRVWIAAAALAAGAAPALAQAQNDVRRDEAQMGGDVRQERGDAAMEARLGAKIQELRERAHHETGRRRAEDLAAADRLDRQYAELHRKAGAAYGAWAGERNDVRRDETQPH